MNFNVKRNGHINIYPGDLHVDLSANTGLNNSKSSKYFRKALSRGFKIFLVNLLISLPALERERGVFREENFPSFNS